MSQQYFNTIATQWDGMRENMFGEEVRAKAIQLAGLSKESVSADIGAGTGFLAAGLAPISATVHLVDFSAEMLGVARQNLAQFDNVQYHLAAGENLPLPDASIDAVLANMYLHHAPEPATAIREMSRILRPGGRLVITDLDEHEFEFLRSEQHDRWLGFERRQVQAWLESAGLVNVIVEDTRSTCSSGSLTSAETAQVSVFAAAGSKPLPGMQQVVQDHYRKIALGGSSCCSTSEITIPIEALGASPASCCQPAFQEASEAEFALGCGNPVGLASLRAGETVLDIGSGGGADVFPAAKRVGPTGKAIGLDMLPEMIARAENTARKAGYGNVEFRLGNAVEIPLPAASVDVVMSNCVINLVDDKNRAFREAFRVLKAGGRLSISDIVTDRPFSPALREHPEGWAECVSGALPEAEYLTLVRQAGFSDLQAQRSQSWQAEDGTLVYSLNLTARKTE